MTVTRRQDRAMVLTYGLAAKLASVVVHADEFLEAGLSLDRQALVEAVADREVKQWIEDLGALAPRKRISRAIARGMSKVARRCPICLKARTVQLGEVIPRHDGTRHMKRDGDFWCGGGGLKLVGVRPLKWERARDSDVKAEA